MMMKKFILILFCVIVFLSGCIGIVDEFNYRTYIIENKSNHEVRLKFFLVSGYNVKNPNETIAKNDRLTGTTIRKGDGPWSSLPEFLRISLPGTSFHKGDSVLIIFDNERRMTSTYTLGADDVIFSEPVDRNIFNHSNYTDIGSDNFLYTITEADYERAEPCDPCD